MPDDQVNLLSNLDIDEVSLVDRGANQHAKVELTKRDEDAEDSTEGEGVEKASPTPSGLHIDQPLGSRSPEKDDDEDEDEKAPSTREEKLLKRLTSTITKAFKGESETEPDEEVEKFGQFGGGQRRPPNLHPGQVPMGMPEQMPMQAPGMQQGPPDMGLEGGGPDQFGQQQEAQMPQGMGQQMPPGMPQDFPGQEPGMPLMDPMGGGSFPGQATQDQGQEPGLAPLPQEVVDYIRELEEQVQEISQSGNAGSEGHNPFGKSEEFTEMPETQQVSLDELAKALENEEQREIVYKALDLVAEAEERAAEAETIAKAERDNRLNREYVEKARSYTSLPITPEEFGPVLKRIYEALPEEDVTLIEKALGEKNDDLGRYFSEVGKQGGYAEPVAKFDGAVHEIQKNDPDMSYEQAFEKAMEANPALYDEYESEKGA